LVKKKPINFGKIKNTTRLKNPLYFQQKKGAQLASPPPPSKRAAIINDYFYYCQRESAKPYICIMC
jgi:hypothetical protein